CYFHSRPVIRRLSRIPLFLYTTLFRSNRDLRREVARPALLVDVRGNAGGNISELVVEKLTRTILGWDLTRDAQPVSYASNAPRGDRKSTRLNSSHVKNSYAVFCLKKKH